MCNVVSTCTRYNSIVCRLQGGKAVGLKLHFIFVNKSYTWTGYKRTVFMLPETQQFRAWNTKTAC